MVSMPICYMICWQVLSGVLKILNFSFYYYWHIYPPITRKRRSAVRARLGVASHLSTTLRWGIPLSAFFNGTTSKLPAFSTLSLKCWTSSREAGNTNFKDIGLTRLGIELQVYRSRSRRSIPLGHLIFLRLGWIRKKVRKKNGLCLGGPGFILWWFAGSVTGLEVSGLERSGLQKSEPVPSLQCIVKQWLIMHSNEKIFLNWLKFLGTKLFTFFQSTHLAEHTTLNFSDDRG